MFKLTYTLFGVVFSCLLTESPWLSFLGLDIEVSAELWLRYGFSELLSVDKDEMDSSGEDRSCVSVESDDSSSGASEAKVADGLQ